MIPVDERIDLERLEHFASNAQHVPTNVRHVLNECLLFDQPPEFYFGQIGALMFMHQLLDNTINVAPDLNNDVLKEKQLVIAASLAMICDHVIKKGWSNLTLKE